MVAPANLPRDAARGFTLIELVVVISILGILTAVALPNYRVSVIQAKEAVLKEDLYRLRELIDQYYADKGRYPETLDSLVEDGYLRRLPVDPMTHQPDWLTEDAESDPDSTDLPGIYDVHSASPGMSLSGTPYSEW